MCWGNKRGVWITDESLDQVVWAGYFDEFTRRNQSRPTKLEVFGEDGAQEHEHGLSFNGIKLRQEDGIACVEIMLADASGSHQVTHAVFNVHQITPKLGWDGRDEALEIVSAGGEISLLCFKPQAMLVGPGRTIASAAV